MINYNFFRIKYNKVKDILGNTIIYNIYYNIPIDNNLVYIESQNGQALNGNLLRICEELQRDEYAGLKIIIRSDKNNENKIKSLICKYKLKNAKVVSSTLLCLCYMERAKYLFTDAGIQSRYVKREGQVFVNTWHGTPFKVMGKSVSAERHSIGSLQRNFLMCDYILFPNKYMQNIFIRDYMLENLWQGRSLLCGYPRNTVFFDKKRSESLKVELGYTNKKIYAYLPTYRGSIFDKKNEKQVLDIINYLREIDNKLENEQILLVKFHLYNNKTIDFSQFKHIRAFPDGYETYDVLNTVDCLITDYSSVFFDFAVTKKKIVLFAYDEEEYFQDRGVYFPFSKLPFPKVNNIYDLILEINSVKKYDDEEFIKTYCPYESQDATSRICKLIFKNVNQCIIENSPSNGKENVLIYAGNLEKNGITTSLINCLNLVDLDKRNYFVTFYRSSVRSPEKTYIIPKEIQYIPIATDPFYTLKEKIAHKRLIMSKKHNLEIDDSLKRAFCREVKKQFYNTRINHVIQFDGYTKNAMLLFDAFKCNKTIYVHSDMLGEIEKRNNQSYGLLKAVYNSYDNVAVVSEDIIDSTIKIAGTKEKN